MNVPALFAGNSAGAATASRGAAILSAGCSLAPCEASAAFSRRSRSSDSTRLMRLASACCSTAILPRHQTEQANACVSAHADPGELARTTCNIHC
jgi:hypothetical protein